MKNNNSLLLYTVKDHLVSEDYFNLYWDGEKNIAWTDLGDLDDLGLYYESEKYVSHQLENKSLINILYNLARRTMFHYKFKNLKPFVKPGCKLLDIGCGSGDFMSLSLIHI